MEKHKSSRLVLPLKSCFFLILATVAFSANACSDAMYLGNPNRPNTVWQPPTCKHGCWQREGHYVKFLTQPTCRDVAWVCGRYDKHGNWIPGHFKVIRYLLVNPGCEYRYPGYPI